MRFEQKANFGTQAIAAQPDRVVRSLRLQVQ